MINAHLILWQGCGKWKREVDAALRRKEVATVAHLLDATLHAVPAAVLDAPPKPTSATAQPLVRPAAPASPAVRRPFV